mgnify:CR=1 FL=1
MKKTFLFLALILSAQVALAQFDPPRVNAEEYSFDRFAEYPKRTLYLWGNVYEEKDPRKADLLVKVVKSKHASSDLYIAIDKRERKRYPKGVWHFVNNRRKADFSVCFVSKGEDFSVCVISLKELEAILNPYDPGLFK